MWGSQLCFAEAGKSGMAGNAGNTGDGEGLDFKGATSAVCPWTPYQNYPACGRPSMLSCKHLYPPFILGPYAALGGHRRL